MPAECGCLTDIDSMTDLSVGKIHLGPGRPQLCGKCQQRITPDNRGPAPGLREWILRLRRDNEKLAAYCLQLRKENEELREKLNGK